MSELPKSLQDMFNNIDAVIKAEGAYDAKGALTNESSNSIRDFTVDGIHAALRNGEFVENSDKVAQKIIEIHHRESDSGNLDFSKKPDKAFKVVYEHLDGIMRRHVSQYKLSDDSKKKVFNSMLTVLEGTLERSPSFSMLGAHDFLKEVRENNPYAQRAGDILVRAIASDEPQVVVVGALHLGGVLRYAVTNRMNESLIDGLPEDYQNILRSSILAAQDKPEILSKITNDAQAMIVEGHNHGLKYGRHDRMEVELNRLKVAALARDAERLAEGKPPLKFTERFQPSTGSTSRGR